MMRLACRSIAAIIAVGGILDPSWTMDAARPIRIAVRAPTATDRARLEQAIARQLGGAVDLRSTEMPDAALLAQGASPDREWIEASTIISALPHDDSRHRIVAVTAPASVLPGQDATVVARVEGAGTAGQVSTVALQTEGIPVATAQHTWSGSDERFDVPLVYAPGAVGLHALTVTSSSSGGTSRR